MSCWCGEKCEVFKATDRALKSEILMFVSEKMQNNAEMSQCPIVTCSGQRLPTEHNRALWFIALLGTFPKTKQISKSNET